MLYIHWFDFIIIIIISDMQSAVHERGCVTVVSKNEVNRSRSRLTATVKSAFLAAVCIVDFVVQWKRANPRQMELMEFGLNAVTD